MKHRLVACSWPFATLTAFVLAGCDGTNGGSDGGRLALDGSMPADSGLQAEAGKDALAIVDSAAGFELGSGPDGVVDVGLILDGTSALDGPSATPDVPSSPDELITETDARDTSSNQRDAGPDDQTLGPDLPPANPDLGPDTPPDLGPDTVTCTMTTPFNGGNVLSNLTLTKACSPYTVTQDITVRNNATLTIEPGVTMRFASNVELAVGYGGSGKLIAEGTATDPITMTSGASSPDRGDWVGITFYANAAVGNSIKHVTLDYCGQVPGGCIEGVSDTTPNAVAIDSVTINHVGTGAYGISVDGNDVNFKITNTTFPAGAIGTNDYAIWVKANSFGGIGSGNSFGSARIQLNGGDLTSTASWINPGTAIVVTDVVYVGDSTNAPTLTIAPGTTMQFSLGKSLWVGYNGDAGQLVAVGTSSSSIIFGSASPSPNPGDWEGIILDSGTGTGTRLAYLKMDYCGDYTACIDGNAGLAAPVTIDHVTFDHVGANDAISGADTTGRLTISNCTFAANAIGSGYYAIAVNGGSFAGIGTGNSFNSAGVENRGGPVTANATWANPGTTVAVTANIIVDGENAPVLTIGPGTTFKFARDTHLQIGGSESGSLVVNGSATGHVSFTSIATTPRQDDWQGIIVSTGGEATLSYADISYSGSGSTPGGVIVQGTGSLTMANSSVKHCGGYGVYVPCDSTHVSIDTATCTFTDNIDADEGPGPTCH